VQLPKKLGSDCLVALNDESGENLVLLLRGELRDPPSNLRFIEVGALQRRAGFGGSFKEVSIDVQKLREPLQ
jgi:hypothetical protein